MNKPFCINARQLFTIIDDMFLRVTFSIYWYSFLDGQFICIDNVSKTSVYFYSGLSDGFTTVQLNIRWYIDALLISPSLLWYFLITDKINNCRIDEACRVTVPKTDICSILTAYKGMEKHNENKTKRNKCDFLLFSSLGRLWIVSFYLLGPQILFKRNLWRQWLESYGSVALCWRN